MTTYSPLSLRRGALALLMAACAAAVMAQEPKVDDKTKKDTSASTTKEGTPTNLQVAAKAFAEGKWDEAAGKALGKAIEEDPKLGTPRVVLSRWLLEARKGPEARAMIEQAIAEAPFHPVCYLQNASFALGEGRLTDAIVNLERALDLNTNPTLQAEVKREVKDQAYNGLAASYERRGDWDMTRRNLVELDRLNPKNPTILQRIARTHLFQNNVSEATKYLEEAYKIDKKMDPPELVVAQFWVSRGDDKQSKAKEQAEERFKDAKTKYSSSKANTAEEKDLSARVHRAYAEWKLSEGNLSAAKLEESEVAKLQPEARETHALKGLILRHEKKPTEAAAEFEKARKNSPNYPYALANLALALSDSPNEKDKELGLEYAKSYQLQNTQNPDGYAVMGYALLQQAKPNLDEADRLLGAVVQAGSISPDTAYYLALLLNKKEKYEQAADLLKKTLEPGRHFIYKAEAESLLKQIEPKVPKKKDPEPAPKK